MAKKFNAEQCITPLNKLRVQLADAPFTEEIIRDGFKSCEIPSNTIFWSEFRNSGIVKRIDQDLYCFVNPEKPIHFRMLHEIYKKYQNRVNQYHNKWYNKKRQRDFLSNPEIRAAIKLLNDNGFEVVQRIVLKVTL